MRYNAKLQEAIRNNQEPLRLIDDDEARREAQRMDAVESYPRGKEHGMIRNHWTDQARFRYYGKRTAKRKGRIRNNVEQRTINGIR